jgi:hypothetical protein
LLTAPAVMPSCSAAVEMPPSRATISKTRSAESGGRRRMMISFMEKNGEKYSIVQRTDVYKNTGYE